MVSKLFLIYFYWLFLKKPTLSKNKTKLKLKQRVNSKFKPLGPFSFFLRLFVFFPTVTVHHLLQPKPTGGDHCSLFFFFFFLSLKQCLSKGLRPNLDPHPAPPQKVWRRHHRPPHPRPTVPKPPNQCPNALLPKRNPKQRRTVPK